MKTTCFLFLLIFSGFTMAFAQTGERLQPGKMYSAGDALYAPRFGMHAIVPEGWSGVLPQESEVFLLTSNTRPIEFYIFARDKGDVSAFKSAWEQGVALDEHIKLVASNPAISDGVLTSTVLMDGPRIDKSKKGFAAVRCSEFGPCITILAVSMSQDFELSKKAAEQFIRDIKFEKPSSASPYSKFDWAKFLRGKRFVMYAKETGGSKETEISFCSDGSFKADATKKGFMKNQNPDYRGRTSGVWTVDGVGETTTLHLQFKKKAPLEITLHIEDEKIIANGERYFVAQANCQ